MAPDDRSLLRPGSSLRNLTHGPSSTSRWRFNRSSNNLAANNISTMNLPDTQLTQTKTNSSAKTAPKVERAHSKMSLFNLFSKPKVERARGHTEVGLAVPMRPQTPPKPANSVTPSPSLQQQPSPPAQQTLRARSSQMFWPASARPTTSYKEPGNSDAPPLFQAFHQSTKHATVQACVFPPEVLMRTQSQRRQAELIREKIDITRDLSSIAENETEAKRLEKSHKRLVSTSVLYPPAPELVNKIYILVTTGHVLQYDDDGPFDRVPEKVLKLGPESAAFACDLIPGKHWVLQISSHAQGDGTPGSGPKNSLLSRLRSQNGNAKKSATSFLLVLESAEEMDSWLSAVRKEIDHQGGMKARDESIRASSSIDGSIEKTSTDSISRHRLSQYASSTTTSRAMTLDSSLQPPHSDTPGIPISGWEPTPDERTASITDSSSSNSVRNGSKRQSTDIASIITTPVSPDQIQLDSLRDRSRYSFMSSATSASGSGTRNTSRDSSPAPRSPLREAFSTGGEAEPLRSAMSLKSFHMNPTNGTASRRRSMQPLPVTDEHSSLSVDEPAVNFRHSFLISGSPTAKEVEAPEVEDSVLSPTQIAVPVPFHAAERLTAHINNNAQENTLQTDFEKRFSSPSDDSQREDSPVRSNSRSCSASQRYGAISPPPTGPLPVPPGFGHQKTHVGHIPFLAAMSPPMSSFEDAAASRQRRLSSTPKPFLRPFPIRPQAQHIDTSNLGKRRRSSATPTSATSPADGVGMRSVTSPVFSVRPPSVAANMTPTSHPGTLHSASQVSQVIRRPTSMQIRPDHAPFIARPVRAIASTPSFVPGKRASDTRNSRTPSPSASSALQLSPSIDTMRNHYAQGQQMTNFARMSMPAMGLPPPAPPPNMPLPAPPPNMPLPPLPPAAACGVAV